MFNNDTEFTEALISRGPRLHIRIAEMNSGCSLAFSLRHFEKASSEFSIELYTDNGAKILESGLLKKESTERRKGLEYCVDLVGPSSTIELKGVIAGIKLTIDGKAHYLLLPEDEAKGKVTFELISRQIIVGNVVYKEKMERLY